MCNKQSPEKDKNKMFALIFAGSRTFNVFNTLQHLMMQQKTYFSLLCVRSNCSMNRFTSNLTPGTIIKEIKYAYSSQTQMPKCEI